MGTKTLTLLSILLLVAYKLYAREEIRSKEMEIVRDNSEKGLTINPSSYILHTNTDN